MCIKMGEDVSLPLWLSVAAIISVGARNTLPIGRSILYWLCSRKKFVKLLISKCCLLEELALLKYSQVAVEDDKKRYWVNCWKSLPKQTITRVLFFRTIYNLRHHHCTLLWVMWRDVHTAHTKATLVTRTIFCHTLAPKLPCPSEMWCTTQFGGSTCSVTKEERIQM